MISRFPFYLYCTSLPKIETFLIIVITIRKHTRVFLERNQMNMIWCIRWYRSIDNRPFSCTERLNRMSTCDCLNQDNLISVFLAAIFFYYTSANVVFPALTGPTITKRWLLSSFKERSLNTGSLAPKRWTWAFSNWTKVLVE